MGMSIVWGLEALNRHYLVLQRMLQAVPAGFFKLRETETQRGQVLQERLEEQEGAWAEFWLNSSPA